MQNIHNEATDRLMEAIAGLTTKEECYALFEDLCTIRELQDMSKRLETAILLDGGMSYQSIAAETDVSSATISRVNKCLLYGAGGYRNAIERFKKTDQKK